MAAMEHKQTLGPATGCALCTDPGGAEHCNRGSEEELMRRHQITRVVLLTTALTGAVALASQARAQSNPPESNQPETQKPESQPSQPETNQPETQQPETQSSQPQTQRSQLVRTSATIERVDKTNRTVSLKGADGESFNVQAGPNVDVNSLKVGDRVGITYYQEMAVSLESSPSTPGAQTMTQQRTQRNGVTSMQTTVTATVVSVNTSNNTVVLRGPHGLHTVHVQDPDLQGRLHTIKPGQTVKMTYTEALATSIERRQ
jgi:hypothetical protein